MLHFHIFTEIWPRCSRLNVLDNFRRNLYPTVAPFRIDKISPNPAVCAPSFTISAFLLSQLDALIGDASSVVWLISWDLSFRFFCFFLKDRRLREASSLPARLSLAVSASPATCQEGETARWEVRYWKSTFCLTKQTALESRSKLLEPWLCRLNFRIETSMHHCRRMTCRNMCPSLPAIILNYLLWSWSSWLQVLTSI